MSETSERISLDIDLTIAPVCESIEVCEEEAIWLVRVACEGDVRRTRLCCERHHKVANAKPFTCGHCKARGRGIHQAWLTAAWPL